MKRKQKEANEKTKSKFIELKKKSKTKKRDGWEDFKISKGGSLRIRCQAMNRGTKPPKQCKRPALEGRVTCAFHGPTNIIYKQKVEILERDLGLYDLKKERKIQQEINEIEKLPPEKIEDTADELKLAIGTLRLYLKNSSDVEISNKPTKLIWLINSIMNFKKTHWEIRHADKVTYTKDQVEYLMIKIRNILQEVIKDTTLLDEIGNKIAKLGVELKEEGFGRRK